MKPTTKPELDLGSHLLPGVAALALFGVMAAVFVTAQFPSPQGFPADANITASIGYAMFNLDFGDVPAESFLVAFLIIALALDAALDGAIILARRETDESTASLLADGGRKLRNSLRARQDAERSDGGRELKRTVLGGREADDDSEHDTTGGDR